MSIYTTDMTYRGSTKRRRTEWTDLMKCRRQFPIMLFFVASQFLISCVEQRSATSIPAVNPTNSLDDPTVQLPQQEMKGLAASVTFHSLHATASRTHAIDLRLSNRESATKSNVSIERITLDRLTTQFRRPPSVTLWNRGSSADFPMVASWNLPNPPPHGTLRILVRYENSRGRVVDVPFQWDVRFDAPFPLGS